jgi:hypothetical protein
VDERRRVSGKQEKEVARRFGAQQHAGSGSGSRKHDSHTTSQIDRAISSGLLIECKTTVGAKKQITIKADDLLSVERAAIRQGRTPVLMFDVGGRRYACLTEEDFDEMSTGGDKGGQPDAVEDEREVRRDR